MIQLAKRLAWPLLFLARLFDTWSEGRQELLPEGTPDRIDWVRCMPFLGLHLACFAVIWVGWSPIAVAVAVAMYFIRMFGVTGVYHRYFSHRTYSTSRVGQFLLALLGASAVQRGPLWWAAHHRQHHKVSDEPADVHSPSQQGLFMSHMGWIMTKNNFPTQKHRVKDLTKYPELVFLDRFDTVVPILTGAAMFFLGMGLEAWAPELGTSAGQMLVWGFFISTVALFHGTCTINSLSHVFGKEVYDAGDTSKNNFWLALITMGEGWHNNHHYYQGSVRQGFQWWQIDVSFYILKMLSWTGFVWDLHPVPEKVIQAGYGRKRDA